MPVKKDERTAWRPLIVHILCYYSHFSLIDFEFSASSNKKVPGCVAAF